MREKEKELMLKAIKKRGEQVVPIKDGKIPEEIIQSIFNKDKDGSIMSYKSLFGEVYQAAPLNLLDILPFDRSGKRNFIKREFTRTIDGKEQKFVISITTTNTEETVNTYFINESERFKDKRLALPGLKLGLTLFFYLQHKAKTEGYVSKKNKAVYIPVSLKELRKLFNCKTSEIKKLLLQLNFTSFSITTQYEENGKVVTADIMKDIHLISLLTISDLTNKEKQPYVFVALNPLFLSIAKVNPNAWVKEKSLSSLSPLALEMYLFLKRWTNRKEFRVNAVSLFKRLNIKIDTKHFALYITRIQNALEELKQIEFIKDYKYDKKSQVFTLKLK